MAGRKSKYGDKVIDALVEALEIGATDADACAYAGISTSTFYEWQNDPLKSEFSDALTRARAKARALAVKAFRSGLLPAKTVTKTVDFFTETRVDREGKPYEYKNKSAKETITIAPPDWRAGRDWLERRDKDNWSPRQEHTGKDGGELIINVVRVKKPMPEAD